MSTSAGPATSGLPLYRTERVIASLTMAWVIILTTYMIFQDHALSYTSIYFLKIILALSGAVMLATLPGFFDVSYSLGGFSVRAAGGAAAFVFIYTQSPNLPVLKIDQPDKPPISQEERRRLQTSEDHLSSHTDSFPVLMTLAVAPALVVPPAARPDDDAVALSAGGETSSGVWADAWVQRLSLGEALSADFQA